MLLLRATKGLPRLAIAGLAKNTGKTQALTTLITERARCDCRLGITSVGRDGECRDVIDHRIRKPRIRVPVGSLVATTDQLIRVSAGRYTVLARPALRTPLGSVVICLAESEAPVEVAGPSSAAGVRLVCALMAHLGADQVIIDGALDRRFAASPAVSDGVVLSTGAVLDEEMSRVVRRTQDAVAVLTLPVTADQAVLATRALRAKNSIVAENGTAVTFGDRVGLSATAAQLLSLLSRYPRARALVLGGAVAEGFVEDYLRAVGQDGPVLVARDPTKVFVGGRGIGWYQRRGLRLNVMETVDVRAITVNPVAPGRHRFDSGLLREQLAEALGNGVPVLDVMAADYPRLPEQG
ncbi:MAG TPA: hypothetical protein VMV92_31725 [Streptosporangiaceae bacterium]|nr:hypothetical protein [Streptosporangiaceae bacterium]